MANNITGYVRVPESDVPNKVFAIGEGGRPVNDPQDLMGLTGAKTVEEAFKEVQIKTPAEARALGIRLPGTPALYPEQSAELTAEMLQSGKFDIPQADSFDVGKVEDRTSFIDSQQKLIDRAEKEANELRERLSKAEETRAGKVEELEELEAPNIQEEMNKIYEKYGVSGDIAQIRTLITEAGDIRGEIANIQSMRDQELMKAEQYLEGKSFIRGEQALIERQYNSRIAAKSAQLEAKAATAQALQGNINMARSLASDMVEAMTWDYKTDRDQLLTFIDIYDNQIGKLSTDYQNRIREAYEAAETIYREKKEEAQEKASLMMAAAENYGISIDLTSMTIEEARQEYIDRVSPIAKQESLTKGSAIDEPLSINQIDQFRSSYGWTPPYGFTETQLLQFMKDNPNATPEELEAGARQALLSNSTSDNSTSDISNTLYLSKEYFRQNYSKDELKSMSDKIGTSKWYTPKFMDINRFLDEVMSKIEVARQEGYSDEEILEYLNL